VRRDTEAIVLSDGCRGCLCERQPGERNQRFCFVKYTIIGPVVLLPECGCHYSCSSAHFAAVAIFSARPTANTVPRAGAINLPHGRRRVVGEVFA
jgi:hypothetical protein